MSESVVVARLAEVLGRRPEVMERFAPGATPEQIERLRAEVGVELPAEMAAFHAFRDGTVFRAAGGITILGNPLLSCRRIVETKRIWDDLAAEYEGMSDEERGRHSHYGLWRRTWVPLQENDHEVVALATEACFDGPAGQVVRFDFKGGAGWTVEHASYGDWLRTMTAIVEAGLEDESRGNGAVESLWARLNPGVRSVDQERPFFVAGAEDDGAAEYLATALTEAAAKLAFQAGDPVKVVGGAFGGSVGKFVERVEGTTRARVEVSVFGRTATVEIEASDIAGPG